MLHRQEQARLVRSRKVRNSSRLEADREAGAINNNLLPRLGWQSCGLQAKLLVAEATKDLDPIVGSQVLSEGARSLSIVMESGEEQSSPRQTNISGFVAGGLGRFQRASR